MIAAGEQVPASLAQACVRDARGGELRVATLYEDRAALLVFLRHFGCLGCSLNLSDLVPRLAELDALGVDTAFIGNGEVEHIAGFVERFRLGDKAARVLTDPRRAAFDAAGLLRSTWSALGPRGLRDVVRGWGRGHRSTTQQGDWRQQGGTLLVAPGGQVRFSWRNRSLGAFAPAVRIVDAALELAARRAT